MLKYEYVDGTVLSPSYERAPQIRALGALDWTLLSWSVRLQCTTVISGRPNHLLEVISLFPPRMKWSLQAVENIPRILSKTSMPSEYWIKNPSTRWIYLLCTITIPYWDSRTVKAWELGTKRRKKTVWIDLRGGEIYVSNNWLGWAYWYR